MRAFPYICAMYIRTVKKQRSKNAQIFYQFTLSQTVRIGKKVKQRSILYLGSDKLMHDESNRKIVLDILKSLIQKRPELLPTDVPAELEKLAHGYYEKYKLRYEASDEQGASTPPPAQKAEMHNIDIKGLEIADVKTFGAEHLCRQVLGKLELGNILAKQGFDKPAQQMAMMAVAARAIFTSSEHKTAQYINLNSELANCFGVHHHIDHRQLYSIADKLYQNRSEIDKLLYNQIDDMFNLDDRLVIFDISNTYFETSKKGSKLAKYGRSKEKRNDCPLVVFTGVINAQGFIRHSRIYEGNKPDSHTLADMLRDLQTHSTSGAKKTVVIDAGIADEDNLTLLTQQGYHYVCVSRKRLKDYDKTGETTTQFTDRGHNKVQLRVFKPKESTDTWMYVLSDAKRSKEASMSSKLTANFEQELVNARQALHKKGGTKKLQKVWQRIGRLQEKHKGVSGQYEIEITHEKDLATNISWHRKKSEVKDDKQNGVYFIRTNYQNTDEKELWDIYNTIREVESTFRCLKTDLQLRPVHHQNDERVASHLYLAILAYQLVNTIRHMLKQHNLHYDWQNILRIMSTQTIQTIELPTDKKRIHLRKPSKPIAEVQEIYNATNCQDTHKAVKKYVVYH